MYYFTLKRTGPILIKFGIEIAELSIDTSVTFISEKRRYRAMSKATQLVY